MSSAGHEEALAMADVYLEIGPRVDSKAKTSRRYYFDATLNEVEPKGSNTFAKITAFFASLPKKNLMRGATFTTRVGVGGVASLAEEAVKEP
jgi:hypothetical protein